jgi:hypothetical protein
VLFEGVHYQKGVGLHGCSSEDKNALGSSLLVHLKMFLGDALYPNFYTIIVLFFCPTSSLQYDVSQRNNNYSCGKYAILFVCFDVILGVQQSKYLSIN